MTCRMIDLGNGDFAIACSRGSRRCKECGARASKQCDWHLKGVLAGKTCDADLCLRCAIKVGPDRDYCGAHWRAHQAWSKSATGGAR